MLELCVHDVSGVAFVFYANTVDSLYDCAGMTNTFFTHYQLVGQHGAVFPVAILAVEHMPFGKVASESFPQRLWHSIFL